MTIKLFLDSGAFSHWAKFSRQQKTEKVGSSLRSRRRDSFSYTEAPDYRQFRHDYAEFVREHEPLLEAYPNLDVIGDPEGTYRNQVYLEDRGLRPLPVWHLGSDEKWLSFYLDHGYEYVCLGGMVGVSSRTLKTALDSLWRRLLSDASGMPRAKVHGFGMTSFELMRRYPWYSVDSKAWISTAQFGGIYYAPRARGGGRDWTDPVLVKVSDQSLGPSGADARHLRTMPAALRRDVARYVAELDLPLGESSFKKVDEGYELAEGEKWVKKPEDGEPGRVEVVKVLGVINHNLFRVDVNLQFLRKCEASMPAWPWALSREIKGKRGLLR